MSFDVNVAPDQTGDIIGATAPTQTTPEIQRQYLLREISSRLAPPQIYAAPTVWGDLMYWMDS